MNESGKRQHRSTVTANSLAALAQARVATQFTSENQPTNKNAGAMMRVALSEMSDWSRAQLQEIVDDQDSPVYRVAAANRLLGAADDGADFDRVVNHTNGQPIARSQNENTTRHVRVIRLPADEPN